LSSLISKTRKTKSQKKGRIMFASIFVSIIFAIKNIATYKVNFIDEGR